MGQEEEEEEGAQKVAGEVELQGTLPSMSPKERPVVSATTAPRDTPRQVLVEPECGGVPFPFPPARGSTGGDNGGAPSTSGSEKGSSPSISFARKRRMPDRTGPSGPGAGELALRLGAVGGSTTGGARRWGIVGENGKLDGGIWRRTAGGTSKGATESSKGSEERLGRGPKGLEMETGSIPGNVEEEEDDENASTEALDNERIVGSDDDNPAFTEEAENDNQVWVINPEDNSENPTKRNTKDDKNVEGLGDLELDEFGDGVFGAFGIGKLERDEHEAEDDPTRDSGNRERVEEEEIRRIIGENARRDYGTNGRALSTSTEKDIKGSETATLGRSSDTENSRDLSGVDVFEQFASLRDGALSFEAYEQSVGTKRVSPFVEHDGLSLLEYPGESREFRRRPQYPFAPFDDKQRLIRGNSIGMRGAYRVEDATESRSLSLQHSGDFMTKVMNANRVLGRRDTSPNEISRAMRELVSFAFLPESTEDDMKIRRSFIIRSSTIDMLVSALARFLSLHTVQSQGCALSLELVRGDDANMRKAFGEAGAILMLTKAIAEHIRDESLVDSGLQALHFILCEEENRHRIPGTTTIETVVTAMNVHCNVAKVQQAGCLFLANSAFKHVDNQQSCVDNAGVEAIVKAMTAHPRDLKIQRRGCMALRNFVCENSNVKLKVIEKKGLEVALRALHMYADNEEVVSHATMAVYNMVVGAPRQRVPLLGMEATINTILRVMKIHMSVDTLQGYLLYILREASSAEGVPARLVKAGGVKVVVDVIKKNVTKRKIIGIGAAILKAIALTDRGKLALRRCGGEDMILDFLYMGINSFGN